MDLSLDDYRTLMGFLTSAKDAHEAQIFLQMWFNEKAVEVYKKGWLDCCNEYDIEDIFFAEDDIDWSFVPDAGYGEF